MERNEKTCCICGEKFKGYGNDPWPVIKAEDAVCCDTCNREVVLPERIIMMQEKAKKDHE